MKPLLILYATRQGQTRRVAERLARAIRDRGHAATVEDVRAVREPLGLDRYAGAVLAASVHGHKHEPEMLRFVKRHRDDLNAVPTAFLSVSLSEAGAEDEGRPEEERAKAASDVQRSIDDFLGETGWRPRRVKAVAGALLYSKYNFLVRFVMRRIAQKASMATDTSRDYEFTNWKAIDAFVDDLLRDVFGRATAQEAPAPA